MGEIRKYTCSCGYGKDLFVGAGLQGVNSNAVARHFSADIVEAFQERRERGEVDAFLLENGIISCPDCRELSAVPYFHYQLHGGEEKAFLSPCPGCGKSGMEVVDPDSVVCPECGQKMEFVPIGDWD